MYAKASVVFQKNTITTTGIYAISAEKSEGVRVTQVKPLN